MTQNKQTDKTNKNIQQPYTADWIQNFIIPINPHVQEDYQMVKKIGRGKYSDVYKAINIHDNRFYVIKVLKPVNPDKIKREIKILKCLNHDSIVKQFDVGFNQQSKSYFLIFQYVQTTDFRDIIENITKKQIQNYMTQILQGLKHSNSQGIMHRDIKPQNLLFNHEDNKVKIADWGLSEFYRSEEQNNVRVCSRHYKAPELLLNNKKYTYSLDIWSLGIVLAAMLFRIGTVFRGSNNPDQLNQYLKHFGYEEIIGYINKHKLQPDKQTMSFIKNCQHKQQRPWSYFIDKQNKELCEPAALDLLSKMLQIDHQRRITIDQALQHCYFQ